MDDQPPVQQPSSRPPASLYPAKTMMRKNSHRKKTFSFAGFMRPDSPKVAAELKTFSFAGFMRPDSPEVAAPEGVMRIEAAPEVVDLEVASMNDTIINEGENVNNFLAATTMRRKNIHTKKTFSFAGFMRPDSPKVAAEPKFFSFAAFMRPDSPEAPEVADPEVAVMNDDIINEIEFAMRPINEDRGLSNFFVGYNKDNFDATQVITDATQAITDADASNHRLLEFGRK